MTSIELQHIGKTFPNAVALDDINLQIPPGELLFLLGPSGCGKSTLLRIIAGLLEPTGGKILFDGRDVTQLHTDQRNAVMCFQNYALWPHMTIRQNVAFGLSMHGGSAASHSARATEVLRLVQLDQYADRKPNSLSGGQQQRAALARALAVEPKCLLLDEPLSNLDAKLRLEMRSEIRRLCKSGGYTTLYVTHDQKEALSIADRIVLLKEGRIAQIGSPAELYHHPCNSFVADFIGQTNLLRGSAIDESSETRRVQTEIGPLLASAAAGLHAREVIVSIRPEKIRVLTPSRPKSPGANHLSGTILENTFLGEASEHIVQINGHPLKLSSSPPILDAAGVVSLEIDPSDCIILPESFQPRRYGYILLFLAILVVPLLAHAIHNRRSQDLSEGSEDKLIIITPHLQEIRDEFRWAFADWHQKKYGQPVELEFLTPGGTTDIRRQLDTIYRAIRDAHGGALPPEDQINTGIDMVWGGGDYEFNSKLKPLGILHPLELDPRLLKEVFPDPTLAGVKLYDQDKDKSGNPLPPQIIGVCLSSFGIIYNPDLYRSLNLQFPRTWSDLADPRLFTMLSMADPSHSGSAATAYMMVIQRAMADAESEFIHRPQNAGVPVAKLKSTPAYTQALDAGWKQGMRQLLLIAANARFFSDSSSQPPDDVVRGDAAAGMAIDFYGRVTEQTVGSDRETFIAPRGATAIDPDPIAILYGTHGKQLELANHFVEFLLSTEGQKLWILKTGQPGGPRTIALRRSPIRQSVYADRTGWADDVNYFETANGFNQHNEWMGTYSELPQIWAAAWIDVRDDLQQACKQILAVPDEQKRAALLAELSDIPITRPKVTAEIATANRITADHSQDPDVWKARQRLNWAKKFAEHYRQVAAKAQGD